MPSPELIQPHVKDLGGGFMVRRSLPSAQRQSVGPFLFFDHFGPLQAQPTDNHDVRPHPHIGLATVTYLFEGAMLHRDSTGVVQRIEPGAINWMTAGRGIVHSERVPDDLKPTPHRRHGLQLWTALPPEHEETAADFQHVSAAAIPVVERPGVAVRVLVGTAFGASSPVRTLSPTVYVDFAFDSGASIVLPDVAAERALYGVDAGFELDRVAVPPFTLTVVEAGSTPTIRARAAARLVMVGGAPITHRFIVWNFVSSRQQRIVQAQDDWDVATASGFRSGTFDQVPGETEFIPGPRRAA